jgi:hypothetical protein
MRNHCAACLLALGLLTGSTWAGTTAITNSVTGKVLEVRNVEQYTYLRLKTVGGELWAAVQRADIRKGSRVTIEHTMEMKNFESKTLKQTFPTILFGNLADGPGSAHAHPAAPVGNADTGDTTAVALATGANAHTVQEIVTRAMELNDQSVQVRGRVVKYNPEIMGKNWVHLRDGSGSQNDQSNDLLVTTMSSAQVGDIVTVSGTVHTNKDFGAGYAYKVIIEDATLKP